MPHDDRREGQPRVRDPTTVQHPAGYGHVMGMVVEPLTGTIGAEVDGIDLRAPLQAEQCALLRDALHTHLVLFFRGQQLTDAQNGTLNPLGINKNADVIKRTFEDIRRVNTKAELFTLINNFYADESNRNELLNQALKLQFKQIAENDSRCHYIDPNDVAIRFSKQLLYWGFHIFENKSAQLAFRSKGGYSYPQMDFLKLVDYLEFQTEIQQAKATFFSA